MAASTRPHRGAGRRRTRAEGDDLFVRGTLSSYLRRVLERYPRIDYPTLELFFWLMDGKLGALRRVVREGIADDERESFDGDLAQADDNGDLARLVCGAMAGRALLRKAVLDVVNVMLGRLAARARPSSRGGLAANLRRAQGALGLTDAEREYCQFVYLVSAWPPAEEYFEDRLWATARPGRRYLCAALGIGQAELSRVTSGKLRRLEIVDDSGRCTRIADDFLPLLDGRVSSAEGSGGLFRRAPAPAVPLEAHLVDPSITDHLRRLLAHRPAQTPVHILLYGAAGTGKTSYARGLARSAGAPGYEVAPDRDNYTACQRGALLACLNRTNSSGEGSIIILDEADRLLNTEFGWLLSGEAQDKGWLNYLLEEPGVRMIWVVNEVRGIAESVRRRFAFSLAFRPLGRKQRLHVWETVLETHGLRRRFGQEDLTTLASEYRLGAGAIDSAVRAAREAGACSREELQRVVCASLDAHRTLLADGRPVRPPDALEEGFVLEAVNVRGDLPGLLRRLEAPGAAAPRRRNANLLFHGPPGTGKSELARYIAYRLDREPLVRRASDILSMWVGEAEKALAAAFAEAERENALLIFDEVDTFLHGRGLATRSWEVTLVNELLVQMERFGGLMIATTNRLEGLDPACLRRFQVKLCFDYLTDAGKLMLYRKMLAPLAGAPVTERTLQELARLPPLAPGDFRVVRDRFALGNAVGHPELIGALAEEARVRREQEGVRTAGFLALRAASAGCGRFGRPS